MLAPTFPQAAHYASGLLPRQARLGLEQSGSFCASMVGHDRNPYPGFILRRAFFLYQKKSYQLNQICVFRGVVEAQSTHLI